MHNNSSNTYELRTYVLLYYRRLDGTSNNKDHVFWGAALEDVARDAPAMYADGIAQPAGANRPSPREISNVLFQQVSLIGNGLQHTRSAFVVFLFETVSLGSISASSSSPVLTRAHLPEKWLEIEPTISLVCGFGDHLVRTVNIGFLPNCLTEKFIYMDVDVMIIRGTSVAVVWFSVKSYHITVYLHKR